MISLRSQQPEMHEWSINYTNGNVTTMEITRRGEARWFDAGAVSVKRYFVGSSLTLIILFAWMEPAGAAGIGFWTGLVFWTIQIAILIPLLIATQHRMSHYLALKSPLAPWIQTAVAGIIAALIFVPIAYALDGLFGIPEGGVGAVVASGARFEQLLPPSALLQGLLNEAAGVVVPVTATWLALNVPWICELDFSRPRGEPPGPVRGEEGGEVPAPSLPAQTSQFIRELRMRASGDIVSMSSELHYLRVVTTDTEVMFLYNLKDAIEELPSHAGVHIHRSHWVAKAHVQEIVKRDGNPECLLSNGKRLPVSRRRYAEVKELLATTTRS